MKRSQNWKATERRIAKLFGDRRTPLSGSGSGGTRADLMGRGHPFYVEVKEGARIALVALFQETARRANREARIPILVHHRRGDRFDVATVELGFLLDLLRKVGMLHE